jgi:hypothetical protein
VHPRLPEGNGRAVSGRRLPQIVRLTPSSYADYRRCARLYLNKHLLRVPESDGGRSGDQGLLVHDMLEQIHKQGSCRDAAHITNVLQASSADTPQMREFVERHARRCPSEFERAAHEVDRVRFHREPKPMFLATARIDAVWIHDGLLDVRDYKTGARHVDRLADDHAARVQAWILARDAQRTGYKLQLRYEYLQPEVDDDPEPWQPGDDDLEAIDDELRSTVNAMWEQEEWTGIGAADVCSTCRYRSICRDSVAASEPIWPVLAGEEAFDDGR